MSLHLNIIWQGDKQVEYTLLLDPKYYKELQEIDIQSFKRATKLYYPWKLDFRSYKESYGSK